ncbi:cytochrome C biogenesis protein [Gemella sanguinis]|uniref:Cytochrome C biogenesis protein n=1 Tax=Gemella sanguinis TaxID=84135 RepID=A0A2N6SFL6_9BACL|nr:cytochrome C biogenesis protein [Gemella sanguinis]PMC52734.1 cytochrome C biogenesis protein [Gemella sanguinis]
MFAIICLNVMLLISCWYLIAENQKNKTQINEMKDDLKKAIERIATLEKNK